MKQPALEDYVAAQHSSIRTRCEWLKFGPLQVYLRAGLYHVDPSSRTLLPALGIANIIVEKQYEGQGLFRGFITQLEVLARAYGYAVVRVEQVHNTALAAGLRRHGYVDLPGDRDDITLVKVVDK